MCRARLSCRSPPRGRRCRDRSADGDLDRCDAGVAGERRGGGEPARSPGAAEQPAGDDRPDPVDLGQSAAGARRRLRRSAAVRVLSRWSAARISATRSRASCLRAVSTGPAGRTPVSSRDAVVGGQVGRCATGDQIPEQGMELVDQPGSLRDDVAAALVEQRQHRGRGPRPCTGFASPCSAATLAAAAASMTSFLRRPPRDSSRTRAVAVEGTSSTRSPRATSHCARCRPRPRAFSTAQRRSLNAVSPPQQPPVTGQ